MVGDGSLNGPVGGAGAGRGLVGRPAMTPGAIPAIGPEPIGGDRVEDETGEGAILEPAFGEGPRVGRGGGGPRSDAPGGSRPYGSRSRL